MSGNVYEWTWDRYGRYSSGTQTDPTGVTSSSHRVCEVVPASAASERYARVSDRLYFIPVSQSLYYGFRLRRRAEQ